MQVVKRGGGSTRSLWGKVCQAIRAVRLELRASKDEILRAYLNGAPYGQNLIGCEAASRRYFGKPASELTLPESALLAGLPRAPSALEPLRHPRAALERRNHVLDRMWADGPPRRAGYGPRDAGASRPLRSPARRAAGNR